MARNEAAEILCEVDAYPPPDSFKWSFNNTAETFEMPQSDYRIHSSRASSLSYMPVKVRHPRSGIFSQLLQFFLCPHIYSFVNTRAESIYLGQASYGHRHQRRRRRRMSHVLSKIATAKGNGKHKMFKFIQQF